MSLRAKTITGATWTMIGQVIIQITQLIMLTILSRLLTPTDFGLMAMVTTITALGLLFSDVGTASALVQRKDLTDTLPSSVFWLNLAIGITLSLLTALLAPLIAIFYREPAVQPMIAVAGIGFTFVAVGIVPRSLLEREMSFARIARGEIVAVFGAATVGITTALLGAGAWSLVYQFLTVALLNSLMYIIGVQWLPRLQFRLADIQSIHSHSSNVTGMRIVSYIGHNFDYMLIGRVLGTHALGYYMLAYRIMLYPVQNLSRIIGRITTSAYARLQGDTLRLQHAYKNTIRFIAALICPCSLGMVVVAEPFVAAAFGPQWSAVAPLLIILAPLGILFALFSSSIAIFESQGHPDIFLRINLLYVGGLLLALSIGVTAGMYGVAWGYVLVTVVFVYISAYRALKIIDLTIRDVWLQIRGFFVSAVIMALIILSVRTMLFTNVAPIWDLSASIALGIVLYILTNLVINRDQVQQMLVHFHFQQMLARFHFRPRNSA